MLLVERGPLSRRLSERAKILAWHHGEHVKVCRGSRQAVLRGDDEAAAAVQCDLMVEHCIKLLHEPQPRLP